MNIEILKKIGLTDKECQVYVGLLQLGPASVRDLADFCSLNRTTTHGVLTDLKQIGLVNYFKENSRQMFVAEDPSKLERLAADKKEEIEKAAEALSKEIAELQAIYVKGGARPVARYYDKTEIPEILQDVLESCEKNGELVYRIYSAANVREYLYDGFATFSDVRVAKGIKVKAIAIGQGGDLRGFDERKWVNSNDNNSTYIIIYPGKTAYISLDAAKKPVAVVIENVGIYETQKLVFDSLWEKI